MNKGTGEYKDEVWGQQQVETCVVDTHLGEFQRTTTRIYTIIDVNYNNYYHMVVFLFFIIIVDGTMGSTLSLQDLNLQPRRNNLDLPLYTVILSYLAENRYGFELRSCDLKVQQEPKTSNTVLMYMLNLSGEHDN